MSLSQKKVPDMKNMLNTWRERLPSVYEDFSIWKDLLECRNFVFNLFNNLLNKYQGPEIPPHSPALLQVTNISTISNLLRIFLGII
jgi:hypothetical protein